MAYRKLIPYLLFRILWKGRRKMCGFAGFVGKVEDRETVLVNMMDTIIHRGPDSAGKYVDEYAAFEHYRPVFSRRSAPL